MRFLHPRWLELGWSEREVVDVSFSGLGLRSLPDDQLSPGLQLTLELRAEGEAPLQLHAEVRGVSASREDGLWIRGLRVAPGSEEDELRWLHLVTQALHPTTRSGLDRLEEQWQLFIDSGYFNLAGKTVADFAELRTRFIDFGRRAARLPRLFCQTVWPSERGVESSLSLMRPYRHTWMLHQLAKRRDTQGPSSGKILRDSYLRTLEHAQSDPGFQWLVSYAESTVPWVDRSHVQFAQPLLASGEALLMPLRMMDVFCDEPSGNSGAPFDLGPATREEKDLLVAEVARTRPACYVEALDFTRERLDLEEAASPWLQAGLQRERAILVARFGGQAVAAMVLELGEAGTNLFRLLDVVRLFPLVPEGWRAYVALLDEARRWYTRRGRTSFVFLREDDGSRYAEAARLHDHDSQARPVLWILPAPRLPGFLEHVRNQTSGQRPRPLSRTAS